MYIGKFVGGEVITAQPGDDGDTVYIALYEDLKNQQPIFTGRLTVMEAKDFVKALKEAIE